MKKIAAGTTLGIHLKDNENRQGYIYSQTFCYVSTDDITKQKLPRPLDRSYS